MDFELIQQMMNCPKGLSRLALADYLEELDIASLYRKALRKVPLRRQMRGGDREYHRFRTMNEAVAAWGNGSWLIWFHGPRFRYIQRFSPHRVGASTYIDAMHNPHKYAFVLNEDDAGASLNPALIRMLAV